MHRVLHILGTPGPLPGLLARRLAHLDGVAVVADGAFGDDVEGLATWWPLDGLDRDWMAPPPLQEASDHERAAVAHRAATLRRFAHRDLLVLADRSGSIAVPAVVDTLGRAEHLVLIVAEAPGRCVSALADTGVDEADALALWERYLRSALQVSEVRPTVLCTLDDPAADDRALAAAYERTAVACGRPAGDGSPWVPAPKVVTWCADPELGPEQRALWSLVRQAAPSHPAGWTAARATPESPPTTARLEALHRSSRLRRPPEAARALQDEIERLRDLSAAAERDVFGLQQRIEELEHRLSERTAERDTAIHERNLSAIELGHLLGRRSVRLAARAADDLRRAARRPLPAALPATAEAPPSVEARTPTTEFDGLRASLAAGRLRRPVTVIVPVYNAPDSLYRCLDSLVRCTPDDTRIVVIDDASPDPAVPVVLDRFADVGNLEVHVNDLNLGFTRTVNRGLLLAPDGDVVLLNADTVVTPGWLRRLRVAACESPVIATVTALSNSAGAFSFECPTPAGPREADAIGAEVARSSRFLRPTAPTGNGFCMLVTAEARRCAPLLDAEAFPRGYGEENDLCMRLGAEGFVHVIADDVVVFHDESASFGHATRRALIERGLAVIDERYPDYRGRVDEFLASPRLHEARAAASTAAATAVAAGLARRTRVLLVIHDGGGGTDFHARDLAMGLADHVEALLLRPDGDDLVLWIQAGDGWAELDRWRLPTSWDVRRMHDDDRARVYLEILTRHDVGLVHLHHLIGHTFDLVELATQLHIPVVATLHDYYLVCPAVLLLDEHGRFCGGTCTSTPGECPIPQWIAPDLGLKHGFVRPWQHATRQLLHSVDAIVAPSRAAADIVAAGLDPELEARIEVIEHGVHATRGASLARRPEPDEPVRLLLVGGLNDAKGGPLGVELTRRSRASELTVEVLGEVAPELAGGLVAHGKYDRRHLNAHFADLRPTFIGVLSPWPETFCYVVSEAWAAGVPVVVGPLGAPAERVARHGGGLIVDLDDPDVIIETVVGVARDRALYDELCAQAQLANVRSIGDMAHDHLNLYQRLMSTTG